MSMALDYDPQRDAYTVPGERRDATPEEVREYHRTAPSESGYGWCDDGLSPYFPGVQCRECGRFVGRDGSIEVEHFEMSSTIASVSGTCARCLAGSGDHDTSAEDHALKECRRGGRHGDPLDLLDVEGQEEEAPDAV